LRIIGRILSLDGDMRPVSDPGTPPGVDMSPGPAGRAVGTAAMASLEADEAPHAHRERLPGGRLILSCRLP
jgi:hypothetical protein